MDNFNRISRCYPEIPELAAGYDIPIYFYCKATFEIKFIQQVLHSFHGIECTVLSVQLYLHKSV